MSLPSTLEIIDLDPPVIPDAPDAPAAGTVQRRGAAGKRDATAKHWCFTLINPGMPSADFLKLLASSAWPTTYAVFQHERAPTTWTKHFQGYVEFSKKMTLASVIKLLPRAHWEKRKGTAAEARDYCMDATKDGGVIDGPYETGTWNPVKSGKRTDLDSVSESLREGASIRDIVLDHTSSFIRYSKGIIAAKNYLGSKQRTPPECVLCFGQPGTGKSRLARDGLDDDDIYSVEPGNGSTWFDGYDGHSRLVFDDFDGKRSAITLRSILRWTDVYQCQLWVKGSSVYLTSNSIWFTTNLHPNAWYDWEGREGQQEALKRRFTRVHWFTGTGYEYETIERDSPRWEHFWKGPQTNQGARAGGDGPMDQWLDLQPVTPFRW